MRVPSFPAFFAGRVGGETLNPERRCGISFGIQHNRDFALNLNRDDEVGGLIIVEVAGGDRVTALEIDGVVNRNRLSEFAVALAVEQVGVVDAGGAGHVQVAVEVEISDHAGFGSDAVLAGGRVDGGRAESCVSIIRQGGHPLGTVGYHQILFAVVAQVSDLHVHRGSI